MGDHGSVTGGGRNTVAEVLGDSALLPEGPFCWRIYLVRRFIHFLLPRKKKILG